MKKLISLLILVTFLILTVSGYATLIAPKAIAQTGNQVRVGFLTNWVHRVNGDSFTNAEVTGQRQWRISHIVNTLDETGEPVRALRVTLDSDLAFDWVDDDEYLTRMGPPTYEWYFGDLSEDYKGRAIDAYVGFRQHNLTKLSPGFDVSRSFDKSVFTATDTQTVTITVTPREEWIRSVGLINVVTREGHLVDPVIISLSGGENPWLSPDGRHSAIRDIPVKLNTPVTVSVTIRVMPKVPKVEYKPNVRITVVRVHQEVTQGTTRGSSFSHTNEAGTWTVSADGDYVWHWVANATPRLAVALAPRVEQPRVDQEPMPAPQPKQPKVAREPMPVPSPTPRPSRAVSWQVNIGSVAGLVIIGLVTYFFVRRQRKQSEP